MTTYETIPLTPGSRLLVEYDESPTCPRGDWHMLTGFLKIPNLGDSRLADVPAVHEDPTSVIYDAHLRLERGGDRRSDLTERVARWARIFHGLALDYDSEHGGYWFVAGADYDTATSEVDTNRALFYDNWPDLAVGSPEHLAKQAEVIASEQRVYQEWASGEVYGVVLERASTFARVEWNAGAEVWDLVNPLTEADLTIEWETVDSIWGCYFDDKYNAKVVALEHFTLTDAETAAAQ